MSSNKSLKRKNPKSYYVNTGWKRRKQSILEKNEQGFLITCNNRERECVREAYSLLGQFAEKLYGPETDEEEEEKLLSEPKIENTDIDAEIAKEIEKLKEVSSKSSERRFQSVDCGAKNCVFIKTKVSDPCELVHSILTTIQTDQIRRSRFILRLIPVTITCRTSLEDIQKAFEPLFPKYFQNTSPEGKTFAIVVKIRNNNTIKRDDLIETLAPMIQKLDAKNKVDLKTPQLSIVIEVIGKISCLSVVSDYFQLKKYNVVELVTDSKEETKVPTAATQKSDAVVETDAKLSVAAEPKSEEVVAIDSVKTNS